MTARFELWTWPTPNGRKVTILLEEIGVAYDVHAIDIRKGAQFESLGCCIVEHQTEQRWSCENGQTSTPKNYRIGTMVSGSSSEVPKWCPAPRRRQVRK